MRRAGRVNKETYIRDKESVTALFSFLSEMEETIMTMERMYTTREVAKILNIDYKRVAKDLSQKILKPTDIEKALEGAALGMCSMQTL